MSSNQVCFGPLGGSKTAARWQISRVLPLAPTVWPWFASLAVSRARALSSSGSTVSRSMAAISACDP